MNSPKTISRTLQDRLPPDEGSEQRNSEPEVWEPPFERWMQMADDLLRHWPHSTEAPRENRV
jgi:hypothetical protein